MKDVYDNPNMNLDGEWNYINHPKSEHFKTIETVASVYPNLNKEDLAHYIRLKSLSSNLEMKLKNEIEK